MELNSILFPSPRFEYSKAYSYEGELVFIPDSKERFKASSKSSSSTNLKSSYLSSNNKAQAEDYIPCLMLIATEKKKPSSNKFLIFFHGNAEDIFGAKDIAEQIKNNLNINVLIVEYPSYSLYNLPPNADKIYQNCLVVYDYLVEVLKIEPKNIYVFGRSIGTASAIYLAANRNPGALISVSGFTSIKAAAQSLVGKFLALFMAERFTSIDYIQNVKCPTIFIHGQKDNLIPFEHSLKLKEKCNCPYEIHLPEDMTHNEFSYEEDLLKPIRDFLERHTDFKNKSNYEIKLPNDIFNMPLAIKQLIQQESKKQGGENEGCFSCVGMK